VTGYGVHGLVHGRVQCRKRADARAGALHLHLH
jgi:hypothetical protein